MEERQGGRPPSVSFDEGVTDILMVTEELKQSLTLNSSPPPDHCQRCLEGVVQRLDFLFRLTLDAPGDDVRLDIFRHCGQRAASVARAVSDHATAPQNEDSNGIPNYQDMQGQAAIARMAELSLMIHGMVRDIEQQQQHLNHEEGTTDNDSQSEIDSIVDAYVAYQRQILRQRSKPAIAQLAQLRRNSKTRYTNDPIATAIAEDEDGDDEAVTHPHTQAITDILGHGSALLHPLLLWKEQVPDASPVFQLCQKAIAVLDEQSQSLTKTVAEWFLVDRKVEDWMTRAAEGDNEQQQQKKVFAATNNSNNKLDLAELDSLVEEMSFCCQILIRYQHLVQHLPPDDSQKIITQELVPEWTWRYAALERFLSTQQWQYALEMACPVDIVVGMTIQVPSILEDAQYLSTRALERAASTLSIQAMGTVAHSVSHYIWSTDNLSSGGVYESLIQQRGCWRKQQKQQEQQLSSNKNATVVGTSTSTTTASVPNSGNSLFASALLDAFDDDIGPGRSMAPSRLSNAPTSDGILGGLVNLTGGSQQHQQQQQLRMDGQLCNLNGIHCAFAACTSLEKLLESHLEETNLDSKQLNKESSMIELAREELIRYGKSYEYLLNQKTIEVLVEWCGSTDEEVRRKPEKMFHALQRSFCQENYELDTTSFRHAEADERLERIMMRPLRESYFLQQVEKCNAEVTMIVCRELSSMTANLILQSLWQVGKRFTDWGSLLLSKQVRLLQNFVCSLVETTEETYNTASLLEQWERISQVVLCLGLEKPSDWYAYQSTSSLNAEDLQRTLSLRVDFSTDTIATVCKED